MMRRPLFAGASPQPLPQRYCQTAGPVLQKSRFAVALPLWDNPVLLTTPARQRKRHNVTMLTWDARSA